MPIVHDDYAPLRSYLNSIVSLDEQEWEKLHAMLTIKHFEKKQLFQASATEKLVKREVDGKIVLKVVL